MKDYDLILSIVAPLVSKKYYVSYDYVYCLVGVLRGQPLRSYSSLTCIV